MTSLKVGKGALALRSAVGARVEPLVVPQGIHLAELPAQRKVEPGQLALVGRAPVDKVARPKGVLEAPKVVLGVQPRAVRVVTRGAGETRARALVVRQVVQSRRRTCSL